MNNEPNKPIEAEELTDKELEGIVGGTMGVLDIAAAHEKAQPEVREKTLSAVQESLIAQAAMKVQSYGS